MRHEQHPGSLPCPCPTRRRLFRPRSKAVNKGGALMRVDRLRSLVVVSVLTGVALSGCSRSLEVTYNPALYRLPQADKLKGIVLGIAKPEDRRASVNQADADNLTYVMRQGSWRFGLTYKGREFVPVADRSEERRVGKGWSVWM